MKLIFHERAATNLFQLSMRCNF